MLANDVDLSEQQPTPESTLCEVRRANLHGRLYAHPRSLERRQALQVLVAAGLAAHVPTTATSLGGWYALPEPAAAEPSS